MGRGRDGPGCDSEAYARPGAEPAVQAQSHTAGDIYIKSDPRTQPAKYTGLRGRRLVRAADVSGFGLFSAGGGAAGPEPVEASSVEDVLDRGLLTLDASPVHIVIRGTAEANTVRCDWRGVARTAGQREETTWTT